VYVLCTVCARGGSKGLPGKNVRPLRGKPLIAHTLELARGFGRFDRTIVSTDSPEIAAISRACGVEAPFLRPAELATDEIGKRPVLRHAVSFVESELGRPIDVLVDLQPTSPLRTPADVLGCLETFERSGADLAVSVYDSPRNPYFDMVEVDGGFARIVKRLDDAVVRRQAAPRVYALNGSVYVYRRDALFAHNTWLQDRVAVHEMPRERSVDIDGEFDFRLAEWLLESGLAGIP